VRNLREALEHVLARHTAVIEEAFRQSQQGQRVAPRGGGDMLTNVAEIAAVLVAIYLSIRFWRKRA
jgi:hypothetical protein